MTTPTNDRRIQYTATALQTTFPYDFEIYDEDEILVKKLADGETEAETLTTDDYSVTGVDELTGGNIVLNVGADEDDIITLLGNTSLIRATDFTQSGDFLANDLNTELDRIYHILQENSRDIARTVLLDSSDSKSSMTLPLSSELAGHFLAFDDNGDPMASSAINSPVTDFMLTLLDDTTALAGRTTLNAQEDVITTRGDIIRGSSAGIAERLALGTAGKFLKSDGTDISWSNIINILNIQEVNAQISSGAFTYTGSNTILQTETTADDDLDTINGGNTNNIIIIRQYSSDYDITFKHGTGNLVLVDGIDTKFTNINDFICFIKVGSQWKELFRANSADFLCSKSANGYTYLRNGLILQWGTSSAITSDSELTITLPLTFPNAILNVDAIGVQTANIAGSNTIYWDNVASSTSQIVLGNDSNNAGTNIPASWFAIGY